MSDEARIDEQDEKDDFEAHRKYGANEEQQDEAEDDVEAHMRTSAPRSGSPRSS